MTLSTSHEIAPSYESEMEEILKVGSDCLGDAY
jgi:hypothetical protein